MTTIKTHHARFISAAAIAALGACGTEDADPCKLDEQAPLVVVGEGREAFAPVADGATMTLEAGPQGGHHVWLALRAQGVAARGSVIAITGTAAAVPATVGPFETIFELRPVGDGFCEVSGVRFQIDQDLPATAFDGKQMTLRVRIGDKSGAAAEDTLDVILKR